jgi:hypothetical protein
MNSFAYTVASFFPDTERVLGLLIQPPDNLWGYTAIPLLLCLVGVHLFFKNFFRVAWFSIKALVAVGVYLHIRELIWGYLGKDPLKIESTIFGVPVGTLEATRLIGTEIAKKYILTGIATVCPNCFPERPPPVENIVPEDDSWDILGYGMYLI